MRSELDVLLDKVPELTLGGSAALDPACARCLSAFVMA